MRKSTFLLALTGSTALAIGTAVFLPGPGGQTGEQVPTVKPTVENQPPERVDRLAHSGSGRPTAAAAVPTRQSQPSTSTASIASRPTPNIPTPDRIAPASEIFHHADLDQLDEGDRFTITPFPGITFAARIELTSSPDSDTHTLVADLPGQTFGKAIISRHDGALYASLTGTEYGNFEISRSGEKLRVRKLTAADTLPCSTHDHGHKLSDAEADGLSNDPDPVLPPGLPPGTQLKAVGAAVQDVLIYYNDQARVVLGGAPGNPADDGDIRAKIADAVAATNVAYANSNVPMTLRAVLVTPIDYPYPTGENLQRALDEIRATTDGKIDGVHATREAVQADIVSLWIENSVGGGKANLNFPANVGFKNAFNVIRAQNPTDTFVHEIGHNHGCRHLRSGYTGTPIAWSTDSFAHLLTVPSGRSYVTAVASVSDRSRTGADSRILYFSAPELTYFGSPTGTNVANNAATVRQTAPLLAAFRGGGSGADGLRPTIKAKTKNRIKTKRRKIPIRGIAADNVGVTSVTYRASGIRGVRTARGTDRWKFKVKLKKRRTTIKVFATDASGLRSRPAKVKVIRKR
ncbi:MAG: M12 family metallo-peptidase [Chthoniobacterales bacterium]